MNNMNKVTSSNYTSIEKSLRKARSSTKLGYDVSILNVSKSPIESRTSCMMMPKQASSINDQDSESFLVYTSIQEDFYDMDDRSSVLFNDSTLTWLSADLESLDFLSLDSGFNSSFSIGAGSASFDLMTAPVTAEIECCDPLQRELSSTSELLFTTILLEFLNSQSRHSGRFDLFANIDLISTIPRLLKSAFVSWSKSSLKRLSHTILNRLVFLKCHSRPSLQYPGDVHVKVSSDPIAYNRDVQLGLLDKISRFSLYEYKSNLIYKFYYYYSFNFC